jgi:transposase InsO family protein
LAYRTGVVLNFIFPGKPVDNAYIESFNGRFRDKCLNEHRFLTIAHTRGIIERRRGLSDEKVSLTPSIAQALTLAGLLRAR